jgi:hypothetical protein
MLCKSRRRSLTHVAICVSTLPIGVLLSSAGCQEPRTDVGLDDPELAAFVRLMMPAKIEIQHYLTKPYDFSGTGDADGLEAILAALDSFGDPIKCVGTFHWELYTMRMASGDKLGERVAFWPVTIDSDQTLIKYWHRYSRYYRFPLKLREGKLRPGRYVLTARLVMPTGEKLVDEYEFTYEGP